MKKQFQFLKAGYLFLLGTVMVAASCTKSGSPNTPDNPGTLTSFTFQKTVNSGISVNSTATINGQNVTLFLPPGTAVQSLVANFAVSNGAMVTVNGAAQTSGVTANNFSQPLVYTVTTPGSSNPAYNYNVTLYTDIPAIDSIVVAFMAKYKLPGMSVAFTQSERLVYAKSYGIADKSTNEAVTNSSLFRLASDSKQFTSVTIMRLLDQGKIGMSDKIFGPGSILGTSYGTQPYHPGVTDITVDQLLHHTCGGWSADGDQYNNYNDPMWSNLAMNNRDLITWTLDNMPLDTIPGTHYAYSNFGYFLLARVIEKITGESYQQAVQDLVLTPCGITDMRIAGSLEKDKVPNEVVYYIPDESQSPYSFNINRADGCAGWIASATDLAKFLVHIDGFSAQADILSPNAIQVMTTGSVAEPSYACGWEIWGTNNSNWEHEGGLPGTSSDQARVISQGNFNYGFVINARNLNNKFGGDLDNIFFLVQPMMPAWPSYDLFEVN